MMKQIRVLRKSLANEDITQEQYDQAILHLVADGVPFSNGYIVQQFASSTAASIQQHIEYLRSHSSEIKAEIKRMFRLGRITKEKYDEAISKLSEQIKGGSK